LGTPSPALKQEQAVLAYLNDTIAWYHQMQATEGRAVQPDEEFYSNNQHDLTAQVVTNAFGYSNGIASIVANEGKVAAKDPPNGSRETRLAERRSSNVLKVTALQSQLTAINEKILASSYIDRPTLIAQRSVLQAQIDLDTALGASIDKAISIFENSGESGDSAGFGGRIVALKKAVPEVFNFKTSPESKKLPPSISIPANTDGIVNRAITLFSLLKYRHTLDVLISKTTQLLSEVDALTDPLAAQLRSAIASGDDTNLQDSQDVDIAQLGRVRDSINATTEKFQNLSDALIPLRQESMALEHSKANLAEWKSQLSIETDKILRVLFMRAVGLALVLFILVAVSEGWRRATFKYVHDARRRRQFLLIRRFATTTLMVVVIVMGFVSDFSSLATFAGFITAGIAVALQTIILSVAAYFFLIGRYGVKVGDRVTVSGVTGDVIDIGLVRVFLMELAGTGVDLHPTGRVVVLANSALFSNTPLYKQLPGTDYAWHEIFVIVPADVETQLAEDTLLKAVNTVYSGYRNSIELQHGALERLLDYKTEIPVPSAHIRLCDSGIEIVIRFPAEMRRMTEIDEIVAKEVLLAIRNDENLKKSLVSMPRIRAAVKS
jgi:small-conductance mechanosensitive channel